MNESLPAKQEQREPERRARPLQLRSNWTREGFQQAVQRAREYIYAGDCYQIVLSQRFVVDVTSDPVEIYRALRVLNPSPY
ncbi:chorismate-binding protein, partial [Acinetobacter baumannii]